MRLTYPAQELLEKARDTLLAAQAMIPEAGEVEVLHAELEPALQRGYFTPDEEARIKSVFARYLHVRSALHQTILSLRPLLPRFGQRIGNDSRRAFIAAWLGGCMLMRSARYMVNRYYDISMVRNLLNRPDTDYGIPEGVFDQIHRNSTRPRTLLRYLRALRIAEQQKIQFQEYAEDEQAAPLLDALEKERPYLESQKRQHAAAYAKCQFYRIRASPSRRYWAVMWGLFEASGRAIAEMRNPFHRKRVRKNVLKVLAGEFQPGDILITRHDDAMSNLFLPGFWPHAALFLGTPAQRQALGVRIPDDQRKRAEDPVCILEAKKDGVRFRTLQETLAVDAFVLFRPRFASREDQKHCIERALRHEGKLYDFEFDFTRSDRLVCTEVVYRALDGLPGFHFELVRKAGRFTLPAEELMQQGILTGMLEVILVYGLTGNKLQKGERAKILIKRSLSI
ncbi:MAG: YiiX/YebB-like N1pC/P60 family cysteine hydrolase [Kiritimatiellia bacterium]